MTTQLELTEPKPPRHDWSLQAERLWNHVRQHPNVEFPSPQLNAICAGEGFVYVSSYSKRCSEVRDMARSRGWDFVKTKDEWKNGRRETGYTLIVR